MKQKDIALIIVVVFISGVFSFVLSNYLFASPNARKEKVEVVEPITANFEKPSNKYFNDQSINPTQLITIGDSTNETPFKQN